VVVPQHDHVDFLHAAEVDLHPLEVGSELDEAAVVAFLVAVG